MIERHNNVEPTTVLFVSASSAFVEIAREFYGRDDRTIDFHTVADSDDTLAFLDRREPYAGAPRPSLVIVDVRGRTNGIEILEAIVEDPSRRRIPVIVLGDATQATSSSTNGSDDTNRAARTSGSNASRFYDSYANAYVHVPDDRESFENVLERLTQFWISTARLPNRDDRVR